MQESGNGPIQKFALDETKHHAYIDRIGACFQNPYLEDTLRWVILRWKIQRNKTKIY